MFFVKLHPTVETNSFCNLKRYLHSLMEALENRDLAYKSMHFTHLARMLFIKPQQKKQELDFKEIDRKNLCFRKSQ